MIKTTYICDVCDKEIEKKNIRGYYINTCGDIHISDLTDEHDRHICVICIENIYKHEKDRKREERNNS